MRTSFHWTLITLLISGVSTRALTTARTDTPSTPAVITTVVHERTAAELVKLKEAGLDNSVLVAYLQNARVPYKASAQDNLFLHEKKISEDVICAWINQSSVLLRSSLQASARRPDLAAAYAAPAQPVVQQQPIIISAPAPTVITAPPVTYSYPTYYYPDYAYWPAPSYNYGFSYGWGRPYWSSWNYYRPNYFHSPWRGGGGRSHFSAGYRGGFSGHSFHRASFGGHYGRGGGGHGGGGRRH